NGDVQVVKHIITEYERPLVYTDRAMTESSATAAGEDDAGEDELPLAFIERKALPAGRAIGSRQPAGALMPASSDGGKGTTAGGSGDNPGGGHSATGANGDSPAGANGDTRGSDARGDGHGGGEDGHGERTSPP